MLKILATVATVFVASTATVSAQDQLTIRVGYSPGGSYDIVARFVADHIAKYLPNQPSVIVSNEPGAGSAKLAKLFQASGAIDGSEIAVISSGLALEPVFDPEGTDFDPTKVHYLAAMTHEGSYCITTKASGITTLDQMLTGNYKVGSTGKDSTTYLYPAAIKKALNANYEIVLGFEGGPEIDLAMERGDIQIRCGIGITTLNQGDMMSRVNILAELGVAPTDEMDCVEFLTDRVTDPATKEALELVFSSNTVHHPFIVPPDTPDEVVEQLRTGFIAMMADPAVVEDAAARHLQFGFIPGAEVEKRIAGFLATDEATQTLARQLVE